MSTQIKREESELGLVNFSKGKTISDTFFVRVLRQAQQNFV
ncbi:MAG: hypothetical protein ACJASQ_001111 [Crocinitomicaceae bacterium]|jgi:hypothetical protein